MENKKVEKVLDWSSVVKLLLQVNGMTQRDLTTAVHMPSDDATRTLVCTGAKGVRSKAVSEYFGIEDGRCYRVSIDIDCLG